MVWRRLSSSCGAAFSLFPFCPSFCLLGLVLFCPSQRISAILIGDGDEIERLEGAVAEVVDDGRARIAQSVILALLVDRIAVHGELCELLHDVQLADLGYAADAVAVQIE